MLTNKEFTKRFKFNGHWFELKALFDKDKETNEFDFDNMSLNTAHNRFIDNNINDENWLRPNLIGRSRRKNFHSLSEKM